MSKIIHVTPINDLLAHDESCTIYETKEGIHVVSNCECVPRIETFSNGSAVVVHSSYDGREALEEAKKILGL